MRESVSIDAELIELGRRIAAADERSDRRWRELEAEGGALAASDDPTVRAAVAEVHACIEAAGRLSAHTPAGLLVKARILHGEVLAGSTGCADDVAESLVADLERLAAAGEEEEIRRRHLDNFLALAEAAEPELFGPDQIAWFARLEDEHDNLRAALAFALDSADPAAALRLAVAVRRFWSIHGHLAEGREALERALAASPDEPTALRARAFNTAGIIAGEQGDFDASRERLEAALETARAADAPDTISAALTNLGNLAFFRGELDAARELYGESIDHFASLEDIRGQALSKENLGLLELTAGDVPKAVRWLTEARDLAREAGVDHEIAAASRSLAAALIELGETDRARKLLAESLTLSREIGEPHAVAVCLDAFAGLAAVVGEGERAATLFGASDAVRSSIGALRQPDDQILYDGWLARTLAQLDTATYSARYDAGLELTLDEACAFALAGSEVLAP
jgi:tetratricopeptide (TPR) repeat protein